MTALRSRRMKVVAGAVLLVGGLGQASRLDQVWAGCQGDLSKQASSASAEHDDDLVAEGKPKQPMTTSEPSTATIRPRPALQSMIKQATTNDGEAPSLRLTLEEISFPANPALGVRVFLNLPNATSGTSIKDPHYVGSISPGERGENEKPMTAFLDLSPTLRKLGKVDPNVLKFTLVAVPSDPDDGTKQACIPVQKVILSGRGK